MAVNFSSGKGGKSGHAKPIALVVSDMASVRQLAAGVLVHLDFPETVEAENLQVAVKALQGRAIGLVICDWDMTGKQGRHLVQVIQASDAWRAIPILLLAEGQASNVSQATQSGATGVVVKPFSPASLQAKVEQLFPQAGGKSGAGFFERI